MNREDLRRALQMQHIREDAYVLDDQLPVYEALGLRIRPGGWEVFYFERGAPRRIEVFDTEDEACRFFLDAALNDPTLRQ